MEQCEDAYNRKINESSGLNSRNAANVKVAQADATDAKFFFQQATANEYAANCEEKFYAAEPFAIDQRGAERAEFVDDVMNGDNRKNSDGAPTIERADVAAEPRRS